MCLFSCVNYDCALSFNDLIRMCLHVKGGMSRSIFETVIQPLGSYLRWAHIASVPTITGGFEAYSVVESPFKSPQLADLVNQRLRLQETVSAITQFDVGDVFPLRLEFNPSRNIKKELPHLSESMQRVRRLISVKNRDNKGDGLSRLLGSAVYLPTWMYKARATI